MKTAPELFAQAMGIRCGGSRQCFYCGASADESLTARDYVRDSFTDRSIVVCPGSSWICQGCKLCLREDAELTMLDGSRRHVTKCAVRAFSWLITFDAARAGSKADIAAWRNICLNPPKPPFAIVLSDSGQKHLLYRGAVCWSQDNVTVTLEAEGITYRPANLSATIDLCTQLIAATGKPALAEPPTARFAQAISDYFLEWELLLNSWGQIYGSPIARLATWLSPGREAAREIVKSTVTDNGLSGISPQVGGIGGPGKKNRSKRKDGSETSCNPSLFDLC